MQEDQKTFEVLTQIHKTLVHIEGHLGTISKTLQGQKAPAGIPFTPITPPPSR